jgi:hypothetical protein
MDLLDRSQTILQLLLLSKQEQSDGIVRAA